MILSSWLGTWLAKARNPSPLLPAVLETEKEEEVEEERIGAGVAERCGLESLMWRWMASVMRKGTENVGLMIGICHPGCLECF